MQDDLQQVSHSIASFPSAPLPSDNHHANVDVWVASISAFLPRMMELESTLSLSERSRVDSLRTERLRRAYIVRHGLLRMILGRLWNKPASEIRLERTSRGKPFSPGAPQSFSVSHSGDLAVFALGNLPFIGIDVEQTTIIPACEELALRYFSPREYRSLVALPPEDRGRGFLACWTAKEAVLKAVGEGIYGGLSHVEVSAGPPLAMLAIESGNVAHWRLQSFTPRNGYLAAVAVKHADLRISCRHVRPDLAPFRHLSSRHYTSAI